VSFDARTLLVVGGILSWILAAVIEFQAARPNHARVLPDPWTLGLLAKGLGLNLLSQRGLVPDLWSISVANSLLLMGPLFCYAALQRVRGVATNFLLIAAVPVSVGILLPIIGFSPAQFPARTIVFTGAALFGFSLNCWSATQLWRAGHRSGAGLILGTSITLATIALAHAGAVAGGGIPGLFGGNTIQLTLYAINDVCIALSTLGYMIILRALRGPKERIDPDLLPDALTGLYSRPAFIRSGQAELERASLHGNSVAVMKIQIDGFDALNATHGRTFADQQLKRLALLVQRDIRNFDLAGRLSEDTVGVLMPELTLAQALSSGERIRAAFASEPVSRNGHALGITISLGACATDPHRADLESAMAAAAACLQRARLAGGNQVATPQSLPSKNFVEGTI
jgi:diguanylate cyclase (GGDEF)-like protein